MRTWLWIGLVLLTAAKADDVPFPARQSSCEIAANEFARTHPGGAYIDDYIKHGFLYFGKSLPPMRPRRTAIRKRARHFTLRVTVETLQRLVAKVSCCGCEIPLSITTCAPIAQPIPASFGSDHPAWIFTARPTLLAILPPPIQLRISISRT
jgi:hypothetical protein